MGRLNILLLALVLLCATEVVELQHESRSLFVALGQEQQAERQIEVDFQRLQLQQVALAKGERVDQVAREKLGMNPPAPGTVVFMPLDGGFQRE
ncbi:MAG TPA: cell division protein FtsL [Limnobacter sp.]|nr:cell division protein FtsL [Limnobacter sp.]